MIEEDLDFERNREYLKAIRKGEVSLTDIEEWKKKKELELELLYLDSSLQYKPDESKIKQLLINCLEEHYGKLSNLEYIEPNKINNLINEITNVVDKYR